MSESMWDGGPATICPHGNTLNLGDTGVCGCRVRIVTKDDLVIDPGPYNPKDPIEERENKRMKIGLNFPEGQVVKIKGSQRSSTG